MKALWITLLAAFLSLSCAHREIKNPNEAMRLGQAPDTLTDDLDRDSLIKGLKDHIQHFSKRPTLNMRFGEKSIKSADYVASLQQLLSIVEKSPNAQEWQQFLKQNFDFYEIFGNKEWGEVFMTSYFDPVIKGSRKPTKEFTQPLYMLPDDLVVIRMNNFIEKFPALEVIRDRLSEQKSGNGILRGRLSKGSNVGAVAEVYPYYDRAEIDSKQSLKGRNLEICYVNPVDSFVLQIQGSGTVVLEDGTEMKVGYSSQNGHPYVPVGKHLTHAIPIEEMSLQRIEKYLHSLPREEQQKYLNKNPSYVFFRQITSQSITSLGVEVIPGRTIATDPRYFPKGALAFLEFQKPVFASDSDEVPTQWQNSQRIVFDQDTGGAIRGPARLDLYWGKGAEAKQAAGVMKHWGRLFYLAPKDTYLAQILK